MLIKKGNIVCMNSKYKKTALVLVSCYDERYSYDKNPYLMYHEKMTMKNNTT